jgi:hypothetical protein
MNRDDPDLASGVDETWEQRDVEGDLLDARADAEASRGDACVRPIASPY